MSEVQSVRGPGNYTLKYSGDKKEREAIIDIIHYLGVKGYKLMISQFDDLHLKEKDNGREVVHYILSFVGIQGYPVNALCDYLKFKS